MRCTRRALIASLAGLPLARSLVARDNLPAPAAPGFRVLFIRHGESTINTHPIATIPDTDANYPLTPLGLQEVSALARSLDATQVISVQSSSRERCLETASPIAVAHHLALTVNPALVEVDFGNRATVSTTTVARVMLAWATGHPEASEGGGESLTALRQRFLPAVHELIRTGSATPGTLVIVSHGAVLMAMLPFMFSNIDPLFALSHPLDYTGTVAGEFVGSRLVCTDWQGTAPA